MTKHSKPRADKQLPRPKEEDSARVGEPSVRHSEAAPPAATAAG
jgi:hypothetical protein